MDPSTQTERRLTVPAGTDLSEYRIKNGVPMRISVTTHNTPHTVVFHLAPGDELHAVAGPGGLQTDEDSVMALERKVDEMRLVIGILATAASLCVLVTVLIFTPYGRRRLCRNYKHAG